MAERVAITGLGVVSALGLGYEPFAENLAAGVSGLAPWSGSEAEPLLVGEVEPYDLRDYLVAEKGYLDRTSELALIAAQLCLRHAGLEALPAARERRGLVVGTQFGCMATATHYCQRVRKRGPRFATPLVFSQSFLNTPASLLSIDYDLAGYHTTLTSGPESGRQAFELGVLALALGQADAVLAGGVDALSAELIAGYDAPLATGDDPEAYVPGAAGGTALGEGAAL
ncbi:MAG TPA: hypothetical protein DCZ72_10220, partial [Armatimonadetes bacterium]|nr:hypothetical protein [Armatimonadota bacterium]